MNPRGGFMEKILPALSWVPRWTSFMGCLYASSKYLGLGNTDSWLYGSSGLAFLLNIDLGLCPSGPTAWKMERTYKMLENSGFSIKRVYSFNNQPDYPQKYLEATQIVRKSIDEGNPAMVFWAIEPEYYIVRGYNDDGVYISGANSEKTPFKKWTELTPSGIIEAVSISTGKPVDPKQTFIDSVNFAIDCWNGSDAICHPQYRGGKAGYQAWIDSFDNPKLNGFGLAYNAQVWAECRMNLVDYLRQAKQMLSISGSAMTEAIECSIVVSECLKMVATQFPFVGQDEHHKHEQERVALAKNALETAKTVEEKMIGILDNLNKAIRY